MKIRAANQFENESLLALPVVRQPLLEMPPLSGINHGHMTCASVLPLSSRHHSNILCMSLLANYFAQILFLHSCFYLHLEDSI